MTARPIFVLGRHRSGTTWLSNILASVPQIYSPMHALHKGVHESAYFSQVIPYCNHGRTAADLRAIKCLFEASDFYMLTGLAEGPDIAALGAAGYFRGIMEAAAAAKGATYWLEKTPPHTLLTKHLSESFPDAILVAVIRNYSDVVASNVHGFGRPGSPWSWLRQSAVTAAYEKIIRANRVPVIRYEALVSDYERTVRSLLDTLELREQAVPESPFARNTSYAASAPHWRWWQRAAIAFGRALVWVWPAAWVQSLVLAVHRRSHGTLPRWFFLMRSQASRDAEEQVARDAR